jgi:hypothetical protein
MPDIKDSVGEAGATNNVHDIALVQAMLKVIKNTKGSAYLISNYDGVYGNDTKSAIINFQKDNNIIPPDKTKAVLVADKLGMVTKNGPTITLMNNKLPATHKTMTIIAKTKTVYLEGLTNDAKASRNSVVNDINNLETNTRTAVSKLIDDMYKTHKIIMATAPTGRRRTFAEQAKMGLPATNAGPGESNHNYGRAVDLGFRDLQWVQGDGTIKKDNYWLNSLFKVSNAKANAFWDARDAIALDIKRNPRLYRLKFERIHLQTFDQATVSSGRSLASLLTKVGATSWQMQKLGGQNYYKTDFGYKKGHFKVGTAKEIFLGNANVTAANLAAAKGVKATTIQHKDLLTAKTLLKNDFVAADNNWKQWKGIP